VGATVWNREGLWPGKKAKPISLQQTPEIQPDLTRAYAPAVVDYFQKLVIAYSHQPG